MVLQSLLIVCYHYFNILWQLEAKADFSFFDTMIIYIITASSIYNHNIRIFKLIRLICGQVSFQLIVPGNVIIIQMIHSLVTEFNIQNIVR